MAEGFDPRKSNVKAETLAEFLKASVVEEIKSVPGIGDVAKKNLAMQVEGDQSITTTHQLLGKFLTLKSEGISQQEHCDAMWYWLKSRGVSSFRSGIVLALAEKLNLMIPGIYDVSNFEEDDDEEEDDGAAAEN